MKYIQITIVMIVAVITFTGMYVMATMNAINDSYQVGLNAFKYPFWLITISVLVFAFLWLLMFLIIKWIRINTFKFMASFSVGILLATTLTFLLGFAPCLKPHPTTEPHDTHHNFEVVIERSLLCPTYSNRSYFGMFVYFIVGGVMFGVSRYEANKIA